MRGLAKDELVLLKLTSLENQKELDWEHDKEFEYKDFMYDVVITEQHGDTTYYYCWLDNDESQLNRQLADLTNKVLGKLPNRKKSKRQVSKVFKSLYFTVYKHKLLNSFDENKHFTAYVFSEIKADLKTQTLPPKTVVISSLS